MKCEMLQVHLSLQSSYILNFVEKYSTHIVTSTLNIQWIGVWLWLTSPGIYKNAGFSDFNIS